MGSPANIIEERDKKRMALVDLSPFSPQLRKLGKHILQNGVNGTLKATCEELKLNYNSITSQIYNEKQKGHDFNAFLEEVSITVLDTALTDVDNALIKGAVSGSNADRKLFYQRTGRLTEETNNTTINILTVAAPTPSSPIDTTARPKGVIDAEVLLPEDKD